MSAKIKISRVLKQDLLVALVFLVLGVANYYIFGLEGGRYPPRGAILRFQGFSYFFPTGLPLLIISLILSIRFFILSYKCEIAHSVGEGEKNIITFENSSIFSFLRKKYSLDMGELTGIKISSIANRGYIFFFVLMALYFDFTFKNGSGNLFLPNLQGFPITGTALLGSGIIAFACCVYLLIQRNPIRITFNTHKIDYCLDISLTDFMIDRESILQFVESIPCEKREIVFFESAFPSESISRDQLWVNFKDGRYTQQTLIIIIAWLFIVIGFLNVFLIQYPFVILGDALSWVLLYLGIFVIFEISDHKPLESMKYHENWKITNHKTRYIRILLLILMGLAGITIIRSTLSLFGGYSISRIILTILTNFALLLISLYIYRYIFKNKPR